MSLLTYLLYKTEKLSVHLSVYLYVCLSIGIFGLLITQQSLQGLKWDLFEMKAVSLRITEFI